MVLEYMNPDMRSPIRIYDRGSGQAARGFFWEFLEYDHKNNTSIWREYMRIRVKLDVRRPMKRTKKIVRRNGTEVMVSSKYERLGLFYLCSSDTY